MPVVASRDSEQISSEGIGLIVPPPELKSMFKYHQYLFNFS